MPVRYHILRLEVRVLNSQLGRRSTRRLGLFFRCSRGSQLRAVDYCGDIGLVVYEIWIWVLGVGHVNIIKLFGVSTFHPNHHCLFHHPITNSLWCHFFKNKRHILNPLSLHILPMLIPPTYYLIQAFPVTYAAFIDARHEALPSRRVASSPIPRIDSQREQSTFPQQSNGSIDSLERQIAISWT